MVVVRTLSIEFLKEETPELREAAEMYWSFHLDAKGKVKFDSSALEIAKAFGFRTEYALRETLKSSVKVSLPHLERCYEQGPHTVETRTELSQALQSQMCAGCQAVASRLEREARAEQSRLQRIEAEQLEQQKRDRAIAYAGKLPMIDLNEYEDDHWLMTNLLSWVREMYEPQNPLANLCETSAVRNALRRELLEARFIGVDYRRSAIASFFIEESENGESLQYYPEQVSWILAPMQLWNEPVLASQHDCEYVDRWLGSLGDDGLARATMLANTVAAIDYFYQDAESHNLDNLPEYGRIFQPFFELVQRYGTGVAIAVGWRLSRRTLSWREKYRPYKNQISGTMVKWLVEYIDHPDTAAMRPFRFDAKMRNGLLNTLSLATGRTVPQLMGLEAAHWRAPPEPQRPAAES
jgi:hypothetical protein